MLVLVCPGIWTSLPVGSHVVDNGDLESVTPV